MDAGTDILLVTVTKIETDAIWRVFEGAAQHRPTQSIDGRVYFDLGSVNGTRLKLTRCEVGTSGLDASQQAIGKGIAALSPAAVIMVGIAFGVSEAKQEIGDVLVSERLRPYELQRVGTESDGTSHLKLRDEVPHASPSLLNLLKSAELTWSGATLRFGTILTGAKLVDNLDFRDALRAFDTEAIGGEMEGGGLYVACQERKVDWILVKAICDFADGHKSIDKDERQNRAAENASRFVRHSLELTKVDWHHKKTAQNVDDLLANVLELAVDSARMPLSSAPINARYFYLDASDGRRILRRHNRLHIERTILTGEHGLDFADLDSDKLVICDAFNSNAAKFKVLEPPSERNYGARLQHQIDDRQKWALGIPVIVNGSACGVVCFYSINDISGNEEQQTLLNIASRVARIFASALALQG